MHEQPSYVFAGGGTGGHLFPGIAVAQELLLRQPDARVLFLGTEREVERKIVAAHGFEHRGLPAEPSTSLRRSPIRFAWRMWRAFAAARRILSSERPPAVIGLGGFGSVPVVLAAWSLRIPIVLLEQNAVAGRATRLLCRRADRVCLSFEESAATLPQLARWSVTGNPVRREIAAMAGTDPVTEDLFQNWKGEAPAEPQPKVEDSLRESRPTLLVLGGSQGAVAVNDLMLQAAERLKGLLSGWRIVHQTGQHDAERVRAAYGALGLDSIVSPFFDDLPALYKRAALAVARAGATSLSEFACAGCPAVLVPYPDAVGNHQWHNARAYETAGAAIVVEQTADPEATFEAFVRPLARLLESGDLRAEMGRLMQAQARPQAARDVVDCIEAVLQESRPGTGRGERGA